MIEIRSLEGVGFDLLTETFNDAFSDYAIPAQYSAEYLRNLVTRRGYRADLAVGAFDAGRLVGFVFNCLDGDNAYNSGTGVVISHRRRGIARQLMERSIATLPARRYILEAIETNERAAALYRDLGFAETRRFQCWTWDGRVIPRVILSRPERSEGTAKDPGHRTSGSFAVSGGQDDTLVNRIRSWCDMEPSWQNDVPAIRRASEPYVIVGDERGGTVVFPSNGDVPLLAVAREHRRRGLGRELLCQAAAAAPGKKLRIMNIDDRNAGIAAFLERCGGERIVRQIEMIIALRGAM